MKKVGANARHNNIKDITEKLSSAKNITYDYILKLSAKIIKGIMVLRPGAKK